MNKDRIAVIAIAALLVLACAIGTYLIAGNTWYEYDNYNELDPLWQSDRPEPSGSVSPEFLRF